MSYSVLHCLRSTMLREYDRIVATEEGILEYPVNIEGRKIIPGVSFL